jgi:hypothetical protein
MYVVTDHNNQNFVILGPIAWKPRYIGDIISDEIQEDVTVTQADESRVPFEPWPGITIRRCQIVHEPIKNPLIQVHQGPIWTYDDANPLHQATATWHVTDRDISQVKQTLKTQVAEIRWKKETQGAMVNIQGHDVWCDTSRGNRDVFLQKFMLMGDTDTVRWKFPSRWLVLSKAELGYIVSLGAAYIQSCFDWENDQYERIDACETLAELAELTFEEVAETVVTQTEDE